MTTHSFDKSSNRSRQQTNGNEKTTTGATTHSAVTRSAVTHSAVALKYNGRDAPHLVAKGKGKLASEIIALAKANDVHIHQDPTLLQVLQQLELGDEIPRELYLAVAKIIAFAYYLQRKAPGYCAEKDQQSAKVTLHSDLVPAKEKTAPNDTNKGESTSRSEQVLNQARLGLAVSAAKPGLLPPGSDQENDQN